ncbi:hypothetical protein [Mariniplasma anaerobium]|uniref:Uncharacterized protein n=1 Tax=Mariniplasma anaerobium TaxID=2735436 RepID=A0A7U9XUK2_9MOLU|nr:hypothetical protein [Mariniplasma anaerobium]BCR35885.1 hypothetical protein MPAN_007780 [Mariniplasma anaerobium]
MRRRLLAAMPLISTMLFLVAGLYLENWKLGWSFFLLIPLSWILLSKNVFKKVNDLIPLIALIVFLWLGFGFELWHPGWTVFLLIPLVNMIVEKRFTPRKIVTVGISVIYITIGFVTNVWHPTWIMLLLIPIINTIFFPYSFNSFKSNNNGWKSDISKYFKDKIIINEEEDEA